MGEERKKIKDLNMADNKKETERAELHRTIWGYTKIVRNMITKKYNKVYK